MALDAPTFLTFEQLVAEVARWSYRPGWTLEVFPHRFDGPTLRVKPTVQNSYRPAEELTLGIDSPIPPMVDTDQFAVWLTWRIQRIESHESREFLRRDGVLTDNPHPDPA